MKVVFKHAVKLFKLVGYWPLETQNRTALFVYKIYFYITMTLFILLTLGMALEIPNAAKYGLKKLVNNISMSAQFTYGLIKLACFSLPVFKSLFRKINATENNIFKGKLVSVKAIYMKYLKLSNKIALHWIVLFLLVDVVFIISPQITKWKDPSADLTLTLDCYFPYDYRNYYKTSYIFVVIEGVAVSVYLTATNMIYLSVIVFIITQLAILKYEIAEGIDTTKFSDEEIHQNLRKITMYYQNISKFVEEFNQVTKFLNLLYFLICIGHTSMIGFEIVTHASVLEAIWESDWYNCSVKNKKNILMIMLQFKKPLKLTVGFSYDISLETMVMVLRMSVSYMITLKQFYALKELNNN